MCDLYASDGDIFSLYIIGSGRVQVAATLES